MFNTTSFNVMVGLVLIALLALMALTIHKSKPPEYGEVIYKNVVLSDSNCMSITDENGDTVLICSIMKGENNEQ